MTVIHRISQRALTLLLIGFSAVLIAVAIGGSISAAALHRENDRQDAVLSDAQAKVDKLGDAMKRQQTALLRANRRLEQVGEDPVPVPAVPGPQGEQGLSGLPGQTGATGPQGPRGSVGPTGAPGASVVGPKGDQGPPGQDGTNGQDGQSAYPFHFEFSTDLVRYVVDCTFSGCVTTSFPLGARNG